MKNAAMQELEKEIWRLFRTSNTELFSIDVAANTKREPIFGTTGVMMQLDIFSFCFQDRDNRGRGGGRGGGRN